MNRPGMESKLKEFIELLSELVYVQVQLAVAESLEPDESWSGDAVYEAQKDMYNFLEKLLPED